MTCNSRSSASENPPILYASATAADISSSLVLRVANGGNTPGCTYLWYYGRSPHRTKKRYSTGAERLEAESYNLGFKGRSITNVHWSAWQARIAPAPQFWGPGIPTFYIFMLRASDLPVPSLQHLDEALDESVIGKEEQRSDCGLLDTSDIPVRSYLVQSDFTALFKAARCKIGMVVPGNPMFHERQNGQLDPAHQRRRRAKRVIQLCNQHIVQEVRRHKEPPMNLACVKSPPQHPCSKHLE